MTSVKTAERAEGERVVVSLCAHCTAELPVVDGVIRCGGCGAMLAVVGGVATVVASIGVAGAISVRKRVTRGRGR